jgi:peptide-methionine (S)-S-oxide reductase
VIEEIDKAGIWDAPVVTEVVALTEFFPAEQYHQDYFRRNPGQGYCRVVIAPKVAKFRKEHLARLKA